MLKWLIRFAIIIACVAIAPYALFALVVAPIAAILSYDDWKRDQARFKRALEARYLEHFGAIRLTTGEARRPSTTQAKAIVGLEQRYAAGVSQISDAEKRKSTISQLKRAQHDCAAMRSTFATACKIEKVDERYLNLVVSTAPPPGPIDFALFGEYDSVGMTYALRGMSGENGRKEIYSRIAKACGATASDPGRCTVTSITVTTTLLTDKSKSASASTWANIRLFVDRSVLPVEPGT